MAIRLKQLLIPYAARGRLMRHFLAKQTRAAAATQAAVRFSKPKKLMAAL
jgi:hypothetical protein